MNFIAHWGIKGQKWGIRRYQNLDGTLTELGRQRYGVDSKREVKGVANYKKFKEKVSNLKNPTISQLSRLTKEDRHEILVKSEDFSVLMKFVDELSTNELNDRLNRIGAKQRLKEMKNKEIEALNKKIENVVKTAEWIEKHVYEPYKKAKKEQIAAEKEARKELKEQEAEAKKQYEEAKKEKERMDQEMENKARNSQIQARLDKLLSRYGISNISEVDTLSSSQRDNLLKELDSESKLTKYIYGGMFY